MRRAKEERSPHWGYSCWMKGGEYVGIVCLALEVMQVGVLGQWS